MHRFWDTVIEPVLGIIQPNSIVEIGSDRGDNTRYLLEFCKKSGAKLYVVDPLPKYDVSAWKEKYGEHLVFHLSLSLNAIPRIDKFNVVLIDGDHNWYTVYNELKLIEKRSMELSQPFPLVMLHDIGWPYGRRDLYYNPETIPEAFRKPYKQKGLWLGSPELLEKGGLNPHLCNSIYENNLQNGVLTAIEDFLNETEQTIEFVKISGIHGLGILVPVHLKEQNKDLAEFIKKLTLSTFSERYVELIEGIRLETEIKLQKYKEEVEGLREALSAKEEEVEKLINWTEDLSLGMSLILNSKRWKAGNALGVLYERVLLKPRLPISEDRMDTTMKRFHAWRKSFKEAKNQAISVGNTVALKSQASLHSDKRSSTESVYASFVDRSPTADIIVCIHNAPDDVSICLQALGRHTNLRRHRIILVDDGSSPETARLVVKYVSKLGCSYIHNGEARGYTRAANQGIAASSAPFVVLLNSDTIVTSGWLEKLIDCALSAPNVACVGPLSNAASWQSIPELTDDKGKWCINKLPENSDLDSYAQAIAVHSQRLYPEVPLVNGFCYLITREALNKVGLLDEENYPQGYGEEDDFSIRSLDAGFHHRIADDCYVYHAKSKSFTQERREQIVAKSKQTTASKHNPARIRAFVDSIRTNEDLLRARVAARLAGKTAGEAPIYRDYSACPLTIGWLQPHLRTVGGIRRAIEMTHRLVAWGHHVVLLTPDGEKTAWLPIVADVEPFSKIRDLQFDVLIVSDPDVIEPFLTAKARLKINYHLHAYILYRKSSTMLKAYYQLNKNVVHIANSHWTAEQVKDYCHIELIIPGGIDRNLFHPVRTDVSFDVACCGSERAYKGTDMIVSATRRLKLLSLANAVTIQKDLAPHICSARVFASGCWFEGFNFCPLEAMACGVPVAMTDDGGSREYARDGENALVVPSRDEKALRDAIHRLLNDIPLRLKFIENGMETAWRYTWDRVTAEFADLISNRLEQ